MKRGHQFVQLVILGSLLVACTKTADSVLPKARSSSSSALVAESSTPVSSVSQNQDLTSSTEVVTGSSSVATDQAATADPETLETTEAGVEGSVETTQASSNHQVMLLVRPQTQEVWYYCAPTTVSMILSARGISIDQHQLAKEMGTYEPFGTHNRDAVRILNQHLFGYPVPAADQAGYRLETVTSVSPEELSRFKQRVRQNIDDGYPMYYTMDMSKIYPGMSGEHNVAGIGYELTPDGQDIAYLYYLDPYPKVQEATHGGLKKVTPQALLTSLLTCEEPNYAW